MRKLLIPLLFILSLCIGACSKNATTNCSFSKNFFLNKKFKLSKILLGNSAITSYSMASDPCQFSTFEYTNDTLITFDLSNDCSSKRAKYEYWNVFSFGGKNYITNDFNENLECTIIDCNSYKLVATLPNGNIEMTFIKQ